MRYFLLLYLVLSVSMSSLIPLTYAGEWFPDNETALTNDVDDVVGEELRNVDDPFRDGSFALTE
jgi:hypothetical protein